MSSTFAFSESQTFTATHAKHMAAKVATDLKRMQRFYGRPSDSDIAAYESEVIELLKGGVLGTVAYGFQRNANWIEPTLRYTARDLAGASANDDDPGRIQPGRSVVGATFSSYLTYGAAWHALSKTEKDKVKERLPFRRGEGEEPGIDGYLRNDRTYSSGGQALERACVVSH